MANTIARWPPLGASICPKQIALASVLFAALFDVPPICAESTPPDSFATRFAAIETAQAATTTSTAPATATAPVADPPKPIAEPPKDVLHGTLASVAGFTTAADARDHYRGLVEKEAAQDGLAPEIAEAVMAVESGYNPAAIGGAGEIGLMQILPSTARMLGFSGTLADLAVPETNIHYGVSYLAQAWRLAGGDLCTAVMKYRAGHGETRFSFLSVNYCLAVRSKLMARGFRVTGNMPTPTFGEPAGGGCGRKCATIGRVGRVNLAALNSQLSAIVVQVRSGR